MSDKPETGTVLFVVALLTIVVLLVDEWLMRAALAFIPAMLLAQRALNSSGAKPSEEPRSADDHGTPVREHVSKLLEHFQKFYATCQQMASGEITPGEALTRTSDLEQDLSSLLEKVTKESPDMKVKPQEVAPLPTL